MKKLLMLVGLLVGVGLLLGPKPAFADPVTFPTSADNAFLNGNLIVTLINHGSFAEEFRKGEKRVILSDNVIEAGHLGGQYIVAADASVYQDPLKAHLDFEGGLRLNLHAIVNRYVRLTPEWQQVIGNIEYGPRVFYDFGKDNAHVWNASFNVGFGFGVGAGSPAGY